MRLTLIIITFLQCVFVLNAKLIPKTSEDLRLSNEDPTEISKEKAGRIGYFKFHNKSIRLIRSSNENIEKSKNLTKMNPLSKSKMALVKKPIPKFMESEEDYQVKLRSHTSQIRFLDSVEHEDEDFNLDDYDFDVNHDEFSSGGKPLEPRKKIKLTKHREHLEPSPTKIEPNLKSISQSKIVIPRNVDKLTYKVTRQAVDKMKEDEYDDEFPTSTKAHVSTKSTVDDEGSDENDESKEYTSKGSVRSIRSPLSFGSYVDKWGEKTSNLVSKILTFLPIFPQIYETKNLNSDVIRENTPMVDPLTGKVIF